MPVAPVFTNADDFTSPIMAAENQTAVGAAGFFAATGTGTVTLTLTGADMSFFTLSDTGALTFNTAPDFEMPRDMAFNSGNNTNDYALTITATASGLSTEVTITIQVTDVNEAPVVATITPSAFTEYSPGTITLAATDVDAGQTLTFALSAPNHGATLTGNTFTWTPGEDDGMVARTFSFTVTDSGTPPQVVTGTFDITATELANRAPTGATITAAAMLTYPDTITLEASATDPDTGDTLTYSWGAGTEGGSIIDVVGGTATYQPPTLAAGDAARMITITVTVSDGTLTTTAMHTVTVNPPAPMGTAPAFTNLAMFTSPISVAENTAAAGAANFFVAVGTAPVNLTLGGDDATRFTLTAGGTLTFATAPDFEMPRGMVLSGSNTNDYALTVTAMNDFGTVMSGAITVTVTDENEAPVLPAITPTTTFVEYTAGTFDITATDVDRPGQTLAFALTGETHGATLSSTGTFTWTPGEDDGGEARTFSVTVTDSATPSLMASTTFDITAMELPNRAPTGASITIADGATMVTNPSTLDLTAAATDSDTGDMLTYTWSSDATGDSFVPATGATTTTTYTPPTVTATTMVTLTVTITDTTDGSVTATQDVTVNPQPVAPVFTNMDTAFTVVEGVTNVGADGQFSATGTGVVTLTLGGTDAGLFTLDSATGTLTFNDVPDFEMPRGATFDATSNTNDYPLTVTATASGLSSMPFAFTVSVTDTNEAPVLAAIMPPAFTEYTAGTITLAATDVDAGQTLTYALTGVTHGATITAGGTFTWTPGEDDGDVARTFSVTVTDDGGPPTMSATGTFDITAVERPNQAPTGATITAAAMLTSPNTIALEAAATDPDTGTTLTYTWGLSVIADGSISPINAASATYTPPTLATGDAARMINIMLTVSDGTLTDTATHTVTVNPPVPTGTAPVFTNSAMFTSPIEAAENQSAAGAANFFAAPGTGATTLTLGGADATRFSITAGGTLTFNEPPNFERPRRMAFNAGSNTNDYALTVTAMNDFGMAQSGAITVRVTDANDAPVFPSFVPPAFTEYSPGTITLGATDVDSPAQTLTYAFLGDTHGATVTGNTFSWTPGEDDGEVLRIFTLRVTDSGTPPMSATRGVNITAMELPNRAPTGVMITNTETTIQNPATLVVTATASDPDTGDMLTYTWSASADGGTFSDGGVGASVTWTPPDVMVGETDTVTLTVSVSDGTAMATDMHDIVVSPAPDTTPVFTSPNLAAFEPGGTPLEFEVTENTLAVNVANFFAATIGAGGEPATVTLSGDDASYFSIADGTLTFNDVPDFDMPRSMPFDAVTNNNDYLLTLTANPMVDIIVRVVELDTAPTFGTMTVADQTFTVGTAVDLTLPVATGGNGAITYTLPGLPDGLTFDAATRILTGTPTTVAAATMHTYTAADGDMNTAAGDEASLMFSITVEEAAIPATGLSLEVFDVLDDSAIPRLLEGASQTYRVVATPTPAGSAFAADQQITFAVEPAPLTPPASASEPYVAYTAVAPGTIPLAVGAASASFTFTVVATDDALDHADYPVTVTASASPATATGTITGTNSGLTLLDNDIRITTTLASASVVAGATATYNVQLSEAPPADTTVTVASQGTGTATVSPATLTFTTGDWNMAQTVTVTGVAAGSTTISHTAPDNSGYEYITNDVAVTVTAAVPTGVTLSVNPATVTESADATTITVTATLVGGTFTEERRVTLSADSASTATAGTDYTPEITHTITIPANAASGSVTIPFTATVDALADSGETVILQRNLATSGGTAAVDREIPVTPATLTINDPAESLAVSLGDDLTVEPGAQNHVVTATVTGANSPEASGLTIVWELLDALPLFQALGGAEVGRLGGIIGTNSGLTLTFPATTAAVLAAATPPLDSVEFTIRLTVTDPMAAAGQGSVRLMTSPSPSWRRRPRTPPRPSPTIRASASRPTPWGR